MSIKPEKYLHIVKAIAESIHRTLPRSVQVDDLISAGCFGLIDAANRFDPTRNIKFETFASKRIRGAILDELRKLDWVPRLVRQRKEAPIKMSSFTDFTSSLSLDEKNENEDCIILKSEEEDLRDKVEIKIRLTDAIKNLKDRYRQAITLYYIEGLTLREAADFMKTTESRVCQIIKKALPILRRSLENN